MATLGAQVRGWDEPARRVVGGTMRMVVAGVWVANLHWKVPPAFGEDTRGGLYKYSAAVLRHSPFAPFTWVTEHVVLPNFRFFGWFTLLAESTVAALLLVGFKTRLVALAGAALTVPILLSVLYYDRADEWSWAYFLMIAAHLLVFANVGCEQLGVDSVRRGAAAAERAFVAIGAVTIVLGVAGLIVGRNVEFAGSQVSLLGGDAGFVDESGALVRRWELKLMWFNPLWALLTTAAGVAVLVGARRGRLVLAGAAGLGALAAAAAIARRFDYVRADGSVQLISSYSNVAVWAGLAVAIIAIALRRDPVRDAAAKR